MGISCDDGGNGDGSAERNTLVGAEVTVVMVMGLQGCQGFQWSISRGRVHQAALSHMWAVP